MESEETRAKVSAGLKGNTPWNKGKTGIYSEETKDKMGSSTRGKIRTANGYVLAEKIVKSSKKHILKGMSEENKQKLRELFTGRPIPEEQRKKISDSLKGRPKSDEARKTMVIPHGWNKGIRPSDEQIAKQKQSLIDSGYKHSEETRRKMSESNKGRCVSAETREKIRLSVLANYEKKRIEKEGDLSLGKIRTV